jgi:hypothetical protein
MYQHILIPTDGSELSKIALQGGIALAKALGIRVTALTVTAPFHVLTSDPSMIADSAGQYEKHVKALADQRLTVAKDIARIASVPCDLVHWSTSIPTKPSSRPRRTEDAMLSKWHRMGDAECPRSCLAAKRLKFLLTVPFQSSCAGSRFPLASVKFDDFEPSSGTQRRVGTNALLRCWGQSGPTVRWAETDIILEVSDPRPRAAQQTSLG